MAEPERPALSSQERQGQIVTAGLVVLGAWGFVGSTNHLLTLARQHGQEGWTAWNVAGPVELLAVLAGWEIRLRHRAQQPARFPKAVVGACVGFVLAANLSQANDRFAAWAGWDWILAVVGAVCFLLAAGLLETRAGRRKGKAAKAAERAATPPRTAQQPEVGSREAKTAPRAAERRTAPRPPKTPDDDVTVRRTSRQAIVAGLVEEAREQGDAWSPDPHALAESTGKSLRSAQDYIQAARAQIEEESAA